MENGVCDWISGSVLVDVSIVGKLRCRISLAVIGVKYDDPVLTTDTDR